MSLAYSSFPTVERWSATRLETAPLDGLSELVEKIKEEPLKVLHRAREVVKGLAALETGAIEGLYDLDRGFTINAAMDIAVLQTLTEAADGRKRALIESQMEAYDFVLDLATNARPIAQAWVRELHAVMCKAQGTYRALTPQGVPQDVALVGGQYKTTENHVRLATGALHRYAPVVDTPAEMEKLVEAILSRAFQSLHPADQAAYMHYAFVAIHPFPDGNGRVARALASVPTYRHYRAPILILADDREEYFNALSAADGGEFLPFRRFIRDKISISIQLLAQAVFRAKVASPDEVVSRINRNFQTRGGFLHTEVDAAGVSLVHYLHEQLSKLVNAREAPNAGARWALGIMQVHRDPSSAGHRRSLSVSEQMTSLKCAATPPAEANWAVQIGVEVPQDAGDGDYFILEAGPSAPELILTIAVADVLPRRKLVAEMLMAMFAERVMAYVGGQVERAGQDSLRKQGFVRSPT